MPTISKLKDFLWYDAIRPSENTQNTGPPFDAK